MTTHFHKHLKDAAESLKIGSAWDLSSKIVPLIHQPEGALLTALTSLEKGEEWLIQPRKTLTTLTCGLLALK